MQYRSTQKTIKKQLDKNILRVWARFSTGLLRIYRYSSTAIHVISRCHQRVISTCEDNAAPEAKSSELNCLFFSFRKEFCPATVLGFFIPVFRLLAIAMRFTKLPDGT
jgi:hypothetical protein